MCKEYGYCRISRKSQNIERQERNIIKAFPKAIIKKEAFTGTKIDGRNEFKKLLKDAEPGDTIIFDSVSRMSRNASEGFELYKELYNKQINLVFLKESSINTEVTKKNLNNRINLTINTGKESTDKFMTNIIEALNDLQMDNVYERIKEAFEQAQKEVDDLHERTKEGIETARRNGKQIGQVEGAKLTTKKSIEAKEKIVKYSSDFNGTLNDPDCIKLIGISRNSFYKYKKEIREEIAK